MTKKSPWLLKAARTRRAHPQTSSRDTAADLHVADEGNGTKRITIPDMNSFRDRLGEEVTEAFCRCFVHTERLSALGDWIRMLDRHEDPAAVTTSRDLWTVLWFVVGTLKEFGIELDRLKGHLRKAGLLARVPHWGILDAVSSTWVHDRKYKQLRDHCSFHTNQEVISRGLQRMVELKTSATFGVQQPDGRGFTRIGLDCQLLGIGWAITEEAFRPLFHLASDHAVTAPYDLHQVFGHVLNARAIMRSDS